MCQSQSEGGRRCAAFTRPRFHAAVDALNTAPTRRAQITAHVEHMSAVAHHAATPTGAAEIAALIDHAHRNHDSTLVEFLTTGRALSEHNKAMREQFIADLDSLGGAATEPVPAPGADMVNAEDAQADATKWDPGTPELNVGEHWSIAEGGTRWHEGGCGAFAIALHERWPHLKIAAEMYHDHGAESVAHAWAYDPTSGYRFHIFGAEKWKPTTRPDYDPDSHRVLLDQSPDDIRRLFRGFNTSEDHVYDAMEVAVEMFDPDYEPDSEADGEFRNHLYF